MDDDWLIFRLSANKLIPPPIAQVTFHWISSVRVIHAQFQKFVKFQLAWRLVRDPPIEKPSE